MVDGNESELWILGETLLSWGMNPTLLDKGDEVIARMEQAVQCREPFRLALLDADMPVMDGFAVAEKIRSKGLAGTAILMLASVGQRGDAERCRELGIAGYLTKPVAQAELLEAICSILETGRVLGIRDRLVTRHTLRESRSAARDLSANSGDGKAAEAIDRSAALSQVEGDMELLRELTDLFLEDCPRRLSEIHAAIARGDSQALARAAHTLKGVLASFCAQPALHTSAKLELQGRAGDLTGAEAACAVLESEIERLKIELTAFVA